MTTNKPATDLPTHITTIVDVPERDRPLYELDDFVDGYSLIAGARPLQALRKAVHEAGHTSPQLPRPAPGKEPTLSRRDWMLVLGAAQPNERKHLLAAAGRGDIRVK